MRLRRALGTDAIETTSTGYRLALRRTVRHPTPSSASSRRAREFAAVARARAGGDRPRAGAGVWRGPAVRGSSTAGTSGGPRPPAQRDRARRRGGARRGPDWPPDVPARPSPTARRLVGREPSASTAGPCSRSRSTAPVASGRHSTSCAVPGRTCRRAGARSGVRVDRAWSSAILRQDPELLAVHGRGGSRGSLVPTRAPSFDATGRAFAGREDAVAPCLARLARTPHSSSCGRLGLRQVLPGAGGRRTGAARAEPSCRRLTPGTRRLPRGPPRWPASAPGRCRRRPARGAVRLADRSEAAVLPRSPGRRWSTTGTPVIVVAARRPPGVDLRRRLGSRGTSSAASCCSPHDGGELSGSAIEAPARRSGLLLEHGLVDLLVRDVSTSPVGCR